MSTFHRNRHTHRRQRHTAHGAHHPTYRELIGRGGRAYVSSKLRAAATLRSTVASALVTDCGRERRRVVAIECLGRCPRVAVCGRVVRARRRRLPPEQLEEEGKGVEHGAGGLHAQKHDGVALGDGVRVLSGLLPHPACAGDAVEGALGRVAVLRLSEHDRAQRLLRVAEGDKVAISGGGRTAAAVGAKAERAVDSAFTFVNLSRGGDNAVVVAVELEDPSL